APVPIGVAQRLLDLLDRDTVGGAAAAAIALGEIEDFLVASVGGNPAFDPRHGLSAQIRHVSQDQLGVARFHRRGTAPQPLALRRFADQPVALMAPVANDLADGSAAEALLRATLSFELGHPNIRVRLAARSEERRVGNEGCGW